MSVHVVEKLMAENPQVLRIAKAVRLRQLWDSSGHDWTHTLRVWNLALSIAIEENADLFITSLAALLHDVGDWKLFDGDEEAGLVEVKNILDDASIDSGTTESVLAIVSQLSFMGGGTPRPMTTFEGEIVQDADRIEAIGAMGIARCFAFGGANDRMVYDPSYVPRTDLTADDYKAAKGDSISHFHEKLLLLKDLMNTHTGQRIAEKRHKVMTRFLDDFAEEWEYSNSLVRDDQVRVL